MSDDRRAFFKDTGYPMRDRSEAEHRARIAAAEATGSPLLAIVGWYEGGRANLSTWVGDTERVRVRNFDPRLGLANVLTEADITTDGTGTEVIIFKRTAPPRSRA